MCSARQLSSSSSRLVILSATILVLFFMSTCVAWAPSPALLNSKTLGKRAKIPIPFGIARESRYTHSSCLALRGGEGDLGDGTKQLTLPFEQIDAFASRPFTGNPAAVVVMKHGKWLPDETLLAIAEENNLSETSFVLHKPKDDNKDSYDLRWFTPTVEIDLCGHATLAAAASVFGTGVDTDELKFQTRSGELTVSRKGERLEMVLPSWPQISSPDLIIPVGQCVDMTPAEFHWLEGRRDGLAVFQNAQEIADLKPDMAKIRLLPCQGLICTAPGPAPGGTSCDIVYRFFAPRLGIDEDPACGSAQCSLVPYWAERLQKTSIFSMQLSKRKAEIFGELQKQQGADDKVLVSGKTVTVIRGQIMVPAE